MTQITHTEIGYRRTAYLPAGRCQVDIWPFVIESPKGLHEGLVVVTELEDNPGPSITNSIEAVAEAIEQELLTLPLIAYRLVEHYPPRGTLPETFDLVHLYRAADRPSRWINPRWTHIANGAVDALAPPGLTPPTEYFAQLAGTSLSAGEGPPADTGPMDAQEGPLSETPLPVSPRKEGTLA